MKVNDFYNMRKRGRKGEVTAIRYLEKDDYEILAHNFWSRTGEIDIVAVKDKVLHFIEVKTWSRYGIQDLEYSITLEKQRRIVETSKYFLFKNKHLQGMPIRYDVIFINGLNLSHIKDAFTGDY